MSDPIDIKALDEYLKGGSDISQRYRELGREEVPLELDRRVLDEARAAVANVKGGRSRSWLRWSAPVALAASLVLVVTVVIESGVQNDASFATKAVQEKPAEPQRQLEQPAAPQFVPEAPPAAAAPEEALAKSAKIAKEEAERSKSAAPEEVRADAKAMRDEILPALPASPPAPVVDTREAQPANSEATSAIPEAVASVRQQADSAEEDLSEVSSTGARVRRAGRTAGPRATMSTTARSETRPAADEAAEHTDPAKWLEEIRDLRRAGKSADADRAWEHFREAFPDFPVAEHDLARKKP